MSGRSQKKQALQLTALLPSSNMRVVVRLHPVEELLTALRMPDVLNTDVDTLFHVAVADDLVDDNTNGGGGNIVDDASSS